MINQNLPNQLKNYILNNGTKKFKFWNNFIIGKAGIYDTDNCTQIITKEKFKRITEIKTSFDSIYGKENWGFTFEYPKTTVLTGILVYFPTLEIENSTGDGIHQKKDVYIFFKLLMDQDFNPGNIKIEPPKVFSTTMNERENFTSGQDNHLKPKFFIHPHYRAWSPSELSLVDYLNFNTFCYGAGDTGSTISSVFLKEQPQEFLDFYLHTVNEFIKVESEDGGPYMRIRNLRDKRGEDTSDRNIITSKGILKRVYRNFISNNIRSFLTTLKYFDFFIQETEVKVKETNDTILKVFEFLEINFNEDQEYETLFYNEIKLIGSSNYLSLKNFKESVLPAIYSNKENRKSVMLISLYDVPFVFEKREDIVKYKRLSINNQRERYPEFKHLKESDFNIIMDIFINELKEILNERIKERNEKYFPTRNAYA